MKNSSLEEEFYMYMYMQCSLIKESYGILHVHVTMHA